MGNSYFGFKDELHAETNSFGQPIDDNDSDASASSGLNPGDYIGRDGYTYNAAHYRVDASDNLVYDDDGNPIPDIDYIGIAVTAPAIIVPAPDAIPSISDTPPPIDWSAYGGADNSGNQNQNNQSSDPGSSGGGGSPDSGGGSGSGNQPSTPSPVTPVSPVAPISSNPPAIVGPPGSLQSKVLSAPIGLATVTPSLFSTPAGVSVVTPQSGVPAVGMVPKIRISGGLSKGSIRIGRH